MDAGCEALSLALDPAVRRAIDDHVRLLLAWTVAINLTAIREPEAVAREHVLDSLSAVPLLQSAGVDEVLDIGSGGGYPGLPIAVALPARRALLVESVGKKARFLEAAIAATGLGGAGGAGGRAEAALVRSEVLATDPRHRAGWQCVTARAVAALAELVELAFPLLAVGGRLIAWKQTGFETELGPAWRAVDALGGGGIEVVAVGIAGLTDHRLVVVTKSGPTPAGYPRSPSLRRGSAW